MIDRRAIGLALSVAALALAAPARLAQTTVVLEPVRDGTIYETLDIFERSNGAGDHFFVGRSGEQSGSRRRGVIAFDLSSIPPGATITAVTLRLSMSRSTSGTQTILLRKMLTSWGEGTSDAEANEGFGAEPTPGDVTWLHSNFPSVFWTTPGGQYSAVQSASRPVAGINPYTWSSTPQLVADVQGWVDNPSTNYGWAVVNNSEASAHTAKRFDSREHDTVANRPRLTIVFTPPAPQCIADWDHNGVVNSTDVSNFINDWFMDQANGSLMTDWDHNGVVNSTDVSSYINDWFASPPACLG